MHLSEKGSGTWKCASNTEAARVIMLIVTLGRKAVMSGSVGLDGRRL
jgi:hypothetical protein